MNFDFVVAGAGLSGSIFARSAAEKGYKVLVVEQREHIAGNAYDFKDASGIIVHKYGPHIFHTNDDEVYHFVCRFADWVPFKLKCEVEMNGVSTPSPFNFKTIDQFYAADKAESIKSALLNCYPNQQTVTVVELLNSTDMLIKEYAQMLFDNDYSLYTAKQWGISPSEIDASVLKRVPVRLDYESMYFTDKYECMPKDGYTNFVENILAHPNIKVVTNTDVLEHLSFDGSAITPIDFAVNSNWKFVYTGPIDRLLNYQYGELPYRSLRFEYQTLRKDSFQNAPVVAYPQVSDFTRITEYKKIPPQNVADKTTIAVEYPMSYGAQSAMEPYYPIPTESNIKLYQDYQLKAQEYPNLILCGRLAEYKYYNMDQAIASVLQIVKKYV